MIGHHFLLHLLDGTVSMVSNSDLFLVVAVIYNQLSLFGRLINLLDSMQNFLFPLAFTEVQLLLCIGLQVTVTRCQCCPMAT